MPEAPSRRGEVVETVGERLASFGGEAEILDLWRYYRLPSPMFCCQFCCQDKLWGTRKRPGWAVFVSNFVGGDGGIRTPDQGFADPCLNHLATSPSRWCRGGDLNPYALTGTAPSRRRVYLFHHLGSTNYLSDPVGSRASTRPDLAAGPQHSSYHRGGGWLGSPARAIKVIFVAGF